MSEALESTLRTPVQYDSYLLRTWRTKSGRNCRWMLEHIGSGERYTFTSLPDLVIFLRDRTGAVLHRSAAPAALPPAVRSPEEQP